MSSSKSTVSASLWMLSGVGLFAINDALLKASSMILPSGEIFFFRSLVSLGLIVLFFKRKDWEALVNATDKRIHFARAILGLISLILSALALKTIQLSSFVTLFYAAPLIASVLAFLILKEPWSNTLLVNLLIGLMGVVLVMAPSHDILNGACFLALAAAFFYACALICAKSLADHPPNILFGWYIILSLPFTLTTLPFSYVSPSLQDSLIIVAMAVIHYGAFTSFAYAFSHASLSSLVGLEYTGLIWSIALGYLMFSEVPDLWSMGGAGLLIWSNLRSRK